MSRMDFESIHNFYERPVFEAVAALAQKNTGTDQQIDAKYMADVACVALNQLLPRYIRHDVDFSFYLSEAERQENLRQIEDSVTKAWTYVLGRKKRG
jgi:hypothetical protein